SRLLRETTEIDLGVNTYPELNLRTYVRGEKPGIYFFNLDAADRLGVTIARTLFELPYYRAEMRVDRGGETVSFESRRVHGGVPPCRFDASYWPEGDRFRADERPLPAFLTERYRFYTEGDGSLYYGDVDHDPWPLHEAGAVVRENDLFAANGFDHPGGAPRLHYSPGTDVTAGRIHRERR
ncbi:MAG: YqjF family protein, partial [Haloarculaceae archaeon]